MILVFLITFSVIYGGIEIVRSLTKLKKLKLTKTAGYAIIIATVTTLFLSTIVFLF